MIVVANTTPIISLSSTEKISILHELFGEIIINQAVYDEIKAKRSYGYDEVDPHFIRTQSIRSLQRFIDESA